MTSFHKDTAMEYLESQLDEQDYDDRSTPPLPAPPHYADNGRAAQRQPPGPPWAEPGNSYSFPRGPMDDYSTFQQQVTLSAMAMMPGLRRPDLSSIVNLLNEELKQGRWKEVPSPAAAPSVRFGPGLATTRAVSPGPPVSGSLRWPVIEAPPMPARLQSTGGPLMRQRSMSPSMAGSLRAPPVPVGPRPAMRMRSVSPPRQTSFAVPRVQVAPPGARRPSMGGLPRWGEAPPTSPLPRRAEQGASLGGAAWSWKSATANLGTWSPPPALPPMGGSFVAPIMNPPPPPPASLAKTVPAPAAAPMPGATMPAQAPPPASVPRTVPVTAAAPAASATMSPQVPPPASMPRTLPGTTAAPVAGATMPPQAPPAPRLAPAPGGSVLMPPPALSRIAQMAVGGSMAVPLGAAPAQ